MATQNTGYESIGATNIETNRTAAMQIECPVAGNIISASIYMDSNGDATDVISALYNPTTDSRFNGTADDVIVRATDEAVNIARGSPEWVTLDFASPYACAVDELLWIAFATSFTTSWYIFYDSNSTGEQNAYGPAAGDALDDPYTHSFTNDWDLSIYVTIDTGGGDVVIEVPLGPVW